MENKEKEDVINIAVCTDNNYAIPCMITVASVLRCHQKLRVHVFVLTEGLSEENERRFMQLGEMYSQCIEIRTLSIDCFDGLVRSGRFPQSIYFRFLLPDILRKEEKVLYLDCDILVRHNIDSFYEEELTGYACAVVEDQRGDDITIHNRIQMFSSYFNSGVMLMNLEYWRKHDVTSQLINYLTTYPERCWFPDQDALNAVLENHVKWADYTYNLQGEMLSHRCYLYLSALKWGRIDTAIQDPCVVHFTDMDKPWYKECLHPFRMEYRQCAEEHPCIGFRIKRRDHLGIIILTLLGKACTKMLKRMGRDLNRRRLF